MLTLNIEGLSRNRLYFSDILSKHEPLLCFIQETWLPYFSESSLISQYPEYNFHLSSDDMFEQPEDQLNASGHVWHGTAVVWHCKLNAHVKPVKVVHTRFAGIKIETNTRTILAISLYLPTSGKDEDFSDCISSLSTFISENTNSKDEVLIGADTNCSEKSTRRRRKIYQDFCSELGLIEIGSQIPTFHHNNAVSSSNIDRFLVTRTLAENLGPIQVECTLETPMNFSCHDLLLSVLAICSAHSAQESRYSETYEEYNRAKVAWNQSDIEQYQEYTDTILSLAESTFSDPQLFPIKCELYSHLLVNSAVKTCALKKSRSCTKSKYKTKISKKLKHARSEYRIRYGQWNRTGRRKDHPTYKAYITARKVLQRIERYERNLSYIKFNNKLMLADSTDKSEVFSLMKKARGVTSTSVKTSILETPVGTYTGQDILEGFTADTEYLGKADMDTSEYDNHFYKMCEEDNSHIFSLEEENEVKIPPMTMADLNKILFNKMKPGKAPDVFHLTVEHLRYLGHSAKHCILNLVNSALDSISLMSCPQVKLGVSSIIYKAKKKPVHKSDSYRVVTVSPQIGAIIDRYIEPKSEAIFRQVQSPDQLGFTQNMSYLLAAVQRGECQRLAIDRKITCYGVSFDGRAAFPSVDRTVQVRELYAAGERGDMLQYSKYTYQNTDSRIKIDGKLGRQFRTFKGSRQGHVKASGHFKAYVNPCLIALHSSNLGFTMGPLCVTVVCIADDVYVLSDCPRKLQAAIDIVGHFGKRYRVIFNANKTKVTITGSKADMQFYKDTHMWVLNGETIDVTEDNEHLGLIVSGQAEESKNVDANIQQCRSSLFALLGAAFAHRSKISPTTQVHLWRIYCLPVLCSGLAALPIRPGHSATLTSFHHKILRGFLKLSSSSPIPALYFLLGEMPITATLHMDTLVLFHNVWANPSTSVHEIVKYILKMSDTQSCTWAVHVRHLCLLYELPDPLSLLQHEDAWPKSVWKNWCLTKIRAHHEKLWRVQALTNSKMTFLNIQLAGLTGRHHPALSGILTTRDVERLRPHLKMLAGDYMTYSRVSLNNKYGGDPACRICRYSQPHQPLQHTPPETIEHILTECRGTAEVRERLIPELLNILLTIEPNHTYLTHPPRLHSNDFYLAQFLLDCTSFNLPVQIRINHNNPGHLDIFKFSRDFCYAVHNSRMYYLKQLKVKVT